LAEPHSPGFVDLAPVLVAAPPFASRAPEIKKETLMLRVLGTLTQTIAVAAVTTTLCAVPALNAQSPAPGPSIQKSDISDQKLDATAAAIVQVASIKQEYQQRVEAAAPSDKERVIDEAKTALVKAVTDQGLSLQEYASILAVAQNDSEVKEKIVQRLRPSEK
jgi:hypothetical protein